MVIRPIVASVDDSEESLLAVEWAVREAILHSAPLRIVSAPAMPSRMGAYNESLATVADTLLGTSERVLAAAVDRVAELAPGLLVDTDLLSGPPAMAVAESGSGGSALVVDIGASSGLAGMVLGSVSRYAVSHAPCPVVVVREEPAAGHQQIAVGLRDPEDTTAALGFAFEEAALRGAALVAVHAWYRFPSGPGAPPGVEDMAGALRQGLDPDQVSDEAARRLADALAPWLDKYPGVQVRCEVVPGHPARVLASLSSHSDLVVLGRHGGPGAGPRVSSIQHLVLNHAHGPVAVVPDST